MPKLKVNSKKFSKSSHLGFSEARKTAAALAVEFLVHLSRDEEELARFLDETGCDPAELRANMNQSGFVEAIFDYLCSDESRLLAFAFGKGIDAGAIALLRQALGGADL